MKRNNILLIMKYRKFLEEIDRMQEFHNKLLDIFSKSRDKSQILEKRKKTRVCLRNKEEDSMNIKDEDS